MPFDNRKDGRLMSGLKIASIDLHHILFVDTPAFGAHTIFAILVDFPQFIE
jgi:hypothetical protein